jgi:dipeptidyl-peptidase-4
MNASLLGAVGAVFLAAGSNAQPAAPSQALTPERVFSSPALSGPAARGAAISPDGRWVTFLRPEAANEHKLDLWIAPTAGGAPRLLVSGEAVEPSASAISDVEKARRERQRLSAVSGVVAYQWREDGRGLLIPAGGALFLADLATGAVTKLEPTGAIDAKISPSGRYVTYVRDGSLFLYDVEGRVERRLSPKGGGEIGYGVAEFVAQEEMGRYSGQWLSPNETAIAYTRVDETPVETAERLEIGAGGPVVAPQKYPRAGSPNAVVELFVRGLAADAPAAKVDLGADPDIYLARVYWAADGRDLYVERQSRDQKTLDLLRVDPVSGTSKVIVHEEGSPWIALNDDFRALGDGDFIWASARSGANQLYLYRRDGVLKRAITHGDAPVVPTAGGAGATAPGLVGVDERRGLVYFMASRDTPIERQLYVTSYHHPGEAKAVTEGHGWWTAAMPRSADAFVGTYSDPATPPATAIYDTAGRRLAWVEQNALNDTHPFKPYADRYPAPEFGVLKAADGQDLHYILQKPVGFDAAKRYPAIVEVYGGPGVQTVTRSWRGVEEKLYLEAGYVLFQLDNRGSSNRDMKFEGALAGRLGSVEVDDQLVGLDWLRSRPFVAADRVGVTGWSYGGYMTLRLLTDPRSRFRAGAAGAPPTDWRRYDTHYTEQYMGDPARRAAAYDEAAIIPRLGRLSGRLLLLQGMSDDNVQFANSLAVMTALQAAGTPFDLMLYPGQRHGISGDPRRLQLWRTFLAFFRRELQDRAA